MLLHIECDTWAFFGVLKKRVWRFRLGPWHLGHWSIPRTASGRLVLPDVGDVGEVNGGKLTWIVKNGKKA